MAEHEYNLISHTYVVCIQHLGDPLVKKKAVVGTSQKNNCSPCLCLADILYVATCNPVSLYSMKECGETIHCMELYDVFPRTISGVWQPFVTVAPLGSPLDEQVVLHEEQVGTHSDTRTHTKTSLYDYKITLIRLHKIRLLIHFLLLMPIGKCFCLTVESLNRMLIMLKGTSGVSTLHTHILCSCSHQNT